MTNTNDSGPGSLRDAIATAAPGDTIEFDVTGTITLSSTLTIDKNLTISGPGAANLAVSGNNSVVVFATAFGTNVTISGLTVSGGFNANPGGWGGGILNRGSMTVSDCVITGNTIPAGGGPGGGIFNYSSLRLLNSTVSGNSAAYKGGGVWNNPNAILEIADSTISANSAGGDGGGVSNIDGTVTIVRTRITGNFTPHSGGGVSSVRDQNPGTTLTLVDSTVSGNSNNGIFNWGNSTLTITGSTISGNTSVGWGGGINAWGTVTITNSTFASNTALSGGGMMAYAGLTKITNSTFSGTGASQSGGGIFMGQILTIKNTVLADSGPDGNCFGFATSAGHNLSDDNSCSSFFIQPGDLNGVPAGLDPAGLQDNGGLTKTFALRWGSPALDAIPVSECTDVDSLAVSIDQRGTSRPQGAACDMGSFESSMTPNTDTGTNVPVTTTTTLPDGGTTSVSLTFANVVSGGETSVTTSSGGPPPPAGFKLMSPPVYYEITTTALFTGEVRVCLSWSGGQISNEANVKLFQNEDGLWVNITDPASIDTVNNTVCGTTTSLSPFTLMEVKYAFGGFLPPVDNEPTANAVKAGASIPVKFSLGGDQGLDIFAAGYPRSQQMQCQTGNPISEVSETVTAGASSLTYDPETDRYTYVWKTDPAWAYGCRQLQLKLADGEMYTARFTFRR